MSRISHWLPYLSRVMPWYLEAVCLLTTDVSFWSGTDVCEFQICHLLSWIAGQLFNLPQPQFPYVKCLKHIFVYETY